MSLPWKTFHKMKGKKKTKRKKLGLFHTTTKSDLPSRIGFQDLRMLGIEMWDRRRWDLKSRRVVTSRSKAPPTSLLHPWTNRPWNGEIREDAAENPCFVHWIPYPQILLTFERGQIGETVRARRESNTLRIRNAKRCVINSFQKKRKTWYESLKPWTPQSISKLSWNYEKINKRDTRIQKKKRDRERGGERNGEKCKRQAEFN